MNDFRQYALIGATASGKTALAIALATKIDAFILSLDSLAIYKEIDIVSAKPTIEERNGIVHFGIDYITPDMHFDVTTFIKLYKEARECCRTECKNLVIVGGTSFYLKMLLEGISTLPTLSTKQKSNIFAQMQCTYSVYKKLQSIDPVYMSKITDSDTYRIQKALEIYTATGLPPSHYFKHHPPKPVITESIQIYEIVWEREILRKRIKERTKKMVASGLIDEIAALEKRYTRTPNCMKAIGIKETLNYLDGLYTKTELIEKIATNTGRLAKRQSTFNRSQFQNVIRENLKSLELRLLT